MSKKTTITKPAPAKETSSNDKARADALAKLNAKAPATAKDANETPTAAPDAKPAKGGGKNAKAARGTPTAERGAKGAKDAKTPKAKPAKPAKAKRISALDAAAQVLQGLPVKEAKSGLSSQDLIDRMTAAGLWTSPGGQTPAATLYAAMIREIASKGGASRFVRLESADGSARGRFAASGASPVATASEGTVSRPRHTTSAPAKPAPAKAGSQKGGA